MLLYTYLACLVQIKFLPHMKQKICHYKTNWCLLFGETHSTSIYCENDREILNKLRGKVQRI